MDMRDEDKDAGKLADIETRTRKPGMARAEAIAAAKLAQQRVYEARQRQQKN
jgi:hypothetical protein